MRASIHFDSGYAPCGFLIVREGADAYSDAPADTVLIQTDWDWPGVASSMGWSPCHDCTDGTIKCDVCGRETGDHMRLAYDFIREHTGEQFESLADYLPEVR